MLGFSQNNEYGGHCLVAGNLCNTNIFDPKDPASEKKVSQKKSNIEWIKISFVGYTLNIFF